MIYIYIPVQTPAKYVYRYTNSVCRWHALSLSVNGRILTIYNIETNIIGIYGKFLKLPPCFYLALEISWATCMQIRLLITMEFNLISVKI